MSLLEDPYSKKPDAINPEGTKFWIDRSTTQYAWQQGLSNLVVYFIEAKDGHRTRAIVEPETGSWVYEHTSLEAIGVKLDTLKLAQAVLPETNQRESKPSS